MICASLCSLCHDSSVVLSQMCLPLAPQIIKQYIPLRLGRLFCKCSNVCDEVEHCDDVNPSRYMLYSPTMMSASIYYFILE